MNNNPDYVPLREAAKLAHRRVATVRELIDKGELRAFVRDRRGIYVKRTDAVALATRFDPYVPPKARTRRPAKKLHPAVKV